MEITRDDVQGRARATDLAESDVDAAADAAYRIRHPWYRCQALTAVADAQSDKLRAMQLVRDAFRAAKEQSEIKLERWLASSELTQIEAAKVLEITQARLESDDG